MGRWSLVVNILAAVLGTGLTVNIAWPRGSEIWYERWSGWVFVAGVLMCASAYYALGGKKRREIIGAPLPAAHSGVKRETSVPLDVEGQLASEAE